MKTFEQIGTAIGELVASKNAAYGDSVARSGDYLRLLFPSGIRPEQYDDVLLLVRDFDKSMRVANRRDALGENPWMDKAGYGICGVHMHDQKEAQATCNGDASAAASQSHEEMPASAARSAAASTTTPTSAKNAPEPSPQPASSSVAPESAPAVSATEAAYGDADVRDARRKAIKQRFRDWSRRNDAMRCSACALKFGSAKWMISVTGDPFGFCSEDCKLFAMRHLGAVPRVRI